MGKSLGQIGYEAYSAHTGGKSLATGDTLPTWQDPRQTIQDAWEMAAIAIEKTVKG